MTRTARLPVHQRLSWIAHALLAGLTGLSALFILISGVDPNDFQASTGLVWAEFRVQEPQAAMYLSRLEALLGVAMLGLSLFGLVVSLSGYRKRELSGWLSMWAFPAAFLLIAGVMFVFGSPIGYFYLVAAAIQMVIQVLAFPAFRVMG